MLGGKEKKKRVVTAATLLWRRSLHITNTNRTPTKPQKLFIHKCVFINVYDSITTYWVL